MEWPGCSLSNNLFFKLTKRTVIQLQVWQVLQSLLQLRDSKNPFVGGKKAGRRSLSWGERCISSPEVLSIPLNQQRQCKASHVLSLQIRVFPKRMNCYIDTSCLGACDQRKINSLLKAKCGSYKQVIKKCETTSVDHNCHHISTTSTSPCCTAQASSIQFIKQGKVLQKSPTRGQKSYVRVLCNRKTSSFSLTVLLPITTSLAPLIFQKTKPPSLATTSRTLQLPSYMQNDLDCCSGEVVE